MEIEGDRMNTTAIIKNLKRFKDYNPKFTNCALGSYNLSFGGEETKIPVTIRGVVQESGLDKIALIISQQTGNTIEDSYNLITREPESSYIRAIIVALSAGLIFFAFSKTTLTGYAISNISGTTSNIGILVCIVGIMGLLYYRLRRKRSK